MNVLVLGPQRPNIEAVIRKTGDSVSFTEEQSASLDGVDLLVSFGYRYVLDAAVVRRFGARAINVHISYLPWNRGADPNLWSFLEDTPKGVTIHRLSEKLDAGDILWQEALPLGTNETLRTSYDKLIAAAEDLFARHWKDIKAGRLAGSPQKGAGSFHRSADKEAYNYLLSRGWDTPVADLIGKASKVKA